MVHEKTRNRVYKNWAEQFQCEISDLMTPRLIVQQHLGSLREYCGIYCFYNGTTCIISAPTEYVSEIKLATTEFGPSEAFDAELLTRLSRAENYKIIGPAYQGYVDKSSFIEQQTHDVVDLVNEHHLDALEEFRLSCNETEWAHSDIELHRQPILARFYDGKIVAAGSWREESKDILSLGIISHPNHRGKGHGKAVVSALTSKGLKTDAIMHFQTLNSNRASVELARSLGYKELASTVAIRIQ